MPTYQRFSFLIIFLTSYIVLYNLFSAKIQPNQQPAQKVLLSEKNEPIKSYNGYKFSCSNCKYGNTPLDDARSPFPLNGNEIFIYKAYYDWRDPIGPRIRFLAVAPCEELAKPTTNESLTIEFGNKKLAIGWICATKCPEYGCLHAATDITSTPFTEEPPNEITVNRGEKSVRLKVNFVPKTYEKGITSCLEPLHWFTEWPRLIVFMELYQFLGYTKFLFTWTTMTKTVKKVLDYYVEKGIAELRPYPLMPYTDTVDPNNSTYHMGEHLVEQHCPFWSKTKYSSNNDIDDWFYMRNKDISLYEWMEEKVKNNSKIGAFSIRHFGLQMNPMLIPKPFNYEEFLKFDGLRGPTIFNNDRSPKAIFLTEFTRQPHTHWILKHFKQKHSHSASVDEIVYLHARASFAGAKLSKKSLNGTQNLMPDVDLLGKDVEEKLQKIRDVTKEIFGENPPPFSRETSEAMAKCTGNWLQKWRCRKPLTGCFDVVKYMEEWVFAKPSEENGWTIL